MHSTALQCLKKYKLIFIDKLNQPGQTSGDMTFGSALHEGINATLTGGDGQQTFDVYWDLYKEKELDYGRYKWKELKTLGEQFLRKFANFHAHKYKLVFAEQRLFGEYKGVKLEGTPDFYGDYNGSTSLRDFKTSGSNYMATKGNTALQLYLYAYLYQANTGRYPGTLGYTVFNKGLGSIQDLTWDFHERDMYTALDSMVEYTKIVDGQQAFPMNYNACHDYNRVCPYFEVCHGSTSKKEKN
jgi:hypothetical protein